MKQMYGIAAVVGVVCGYLSTHTTLQGTWWNLVLWAAAGIVLGYFVEEKQEVRWTGIVFGAFLSVSFLLLGFGGTPDKLPAYSLLIAILTVIGALCGWLVVYIGAYLRR